MQWIARVFAGMLIIDPRGSPGTHVALCDQIVMYRDGFRTGVRWSCLASSRRVRACYDWRLGTWDLCLAAIAAAPGAPAAVTLCSGGGPDWIRTVDPGERSAI